jgi:hypothetical protein
LRHKYIVWALDIVQVFDVRSQKEIFTVDPEVEKGSRERSRWGREALPDTFFASVARVMLRGSAVDVLALEQRLRVSGEAAARGDDLERLEVQATEIGRLGSERNDLQVRYDAFDAEHAALRNV